MAEVKSGIAHHTTRSRFDSIMSSAEKIELKADPAWMKILGFSKLDTPPESISFDNWSPDPWTITGSGGGAIMTFSQIGVTVLKAQMSSGEVITRYLFAANIQSDGWQGSRNPGASIIEGETFVQIGFKNAQGGVIYSDQFKVFSYCGISGQQFIANPIGLDIIDLIKGAHLSMPLQSFDRC